MNRKWIVIVLCVVLVGIIVYSGIEIYTRNHRTKDTTPEDEASYPGEKGVLLLRDKDPTDIIWKGKKYAYPDRYPYNFSVPVRYENELLEKTLDIRKGYNRGLIILSDRDGKLDISREELERCIHKATDNRRYFFLYLGNNRLGEIVSVLQEQLDLSETEIDYTEAGAIGVLLLSDGTVRIVMNAVIDASVPEDDGWIWEYIAVDASLGLFDGSLFDK